MDLATYREVLTFKYDREPSSLPQFGYNESELALRQDMAMMKVVWYNSFFKDWWCFMRNTHPVLATCFSHRLHVVSKRKRFFVYYMLIALHMALSVLAAEAQTCTFNFECVLNGTDVRRWCCTVRALGLLQLFRAFGVWGLSALFAIVSVVLGQLWFLIAACGCCQYSRSRQVWERGAWLALVVNGGLATVTIVYSVYYIAVVNMWAATARSFGIMKSISFLGAFIFQSLIFFNLWRAQTRRPHEFVDKFHVVIDDVLDAQQANGGEPSLKFRRANSVFVDRRPGARAHWPRLWRRATPRAAADGATDADAADAPTAEPPTCSTGKSACGAYRGGGDDDESAGARSSLTADGARGCHMRAPLPRRARSHPEPGADGRRSTPHALSRATPTKRRFPGLATFRSDGPPTVAATRARARRDADASGPPSPKPYIPPPRQPAPSHDALLERERDAAARAERARARFDCTGAELSATHARLDAVAAMLGGQTAPGTPPPPRPVRADAVGGWILGGDGGADDAEKTPPRPPRASSQWAVAPEQRTPPSERLPEAAPPPPPMPLAANTAAREPEARGAGRTTVISEAVDAAVRH